MIWGYESNISRENVMRDGVEEIHSDTLGAIRNRREEVLITPATSMYPNFTSQLLDGTAGLHTY
jgi:hypothetical protein